MNGGVRDLPCFEYRTTVDSLGYAVPAKSSAVGQFLAEHPEVRFHFTTKYSSCYALPAQIRPNDSSWPATTLTYNGAFQVTSVTGADGINAYTEYDTFGRPSVSRGPIKPGLAQERAITIYSYTPTTQTATMGTRWKRTTFDGFARVVKVETGYSGTTVSTVDSEYAPCSCNPLGKVWRQSAPYAPGEAVRWTTYLYDCVGRTVTVKRADNEITTYLYQGRSTTMTDPKGKWKKFTTDKPAA